MISIVEFDFATKQDRQIGLAEVPAARTAGRFCWVDVSAPTESELSDLFAALPVNSDVRNEVLGPDREGRIDVYEDALHFSLTEIRMREGEMQTAHVDVVVGAGFLLTFHRRDAEFLKRLRRSYREDFVQFSKSHGFLLYELGDHLLDQHRRALQEATDAVENVQMRLFAAVDDGIFKEVALLASDLNSLRRVLLGAREVLHEIAARRSPFIPESTQPFLDRMAGTTERLVADTNASRELLHETLNLYLGMVSHKTNRIVNRLTILSMIFLPLTFLCGVYGMNFDVMPELKWSYGYPAFWIVALTLAATLLVVMRRARWV
ncbi:MAG: magnesium transporter CorA family protein [Verrucomicrobia bacterium]|nr:magnesium transporter CorA family protein [Verrucomicrobiota bacterium]